MPLHHEVASLLDLMEQVGLPPVEEQGAVAARAARRGDAAARRPRTATRSSTSTPAAFRPGSTGRRRRCPRPGCSSGSTVAAGCVGDLDSHDNICRALTNRTGHTVLSIGYRLAPEDPFPAGLDDCVEATKWAHENAVDARRRSRPTRRRRRFCRRQPGRRRLPSARRCRSGSSSSCTRSPTRRPTAASYERERDGLLPHRDQHAVVHRPVHLG